MNGNTPHVWKRLASWPLTVSLVYMTVGAAWIACSDYAASLLAGSLAEGVRFQTIKGTGYVLVTGIILFFMLDRIHAALERSRKNLVRVNGILRVIGAVHRCAMGPGDECGLYETAVREIAGTGEYDAAWVVVYDDGPDNLRVAATAAASVGGTIPPITEPERTVASRAIESGSPEFREAEAREGGRFSAAYPIRPLDTPHGALVIRADNPGAFSGDAGRRLDELAHALSLAAGSILESTKRAAVERELRIERDFLARLMETNPSGIIRFDREGRVLYMNTAGERAFGMKRENTIGIGFNSPEWGVSDQDGNPLSDEEYPFMLAKTMNDTAQNVVLSHNRPDGTRAYLRISAVPLRDDAGAFDGVLSSIEDITTFIQTERDLLETNAILNSLVMSSPVAVTMIGRDGRVLFMNPACEELSCWSVGGTNSGDEQFLFESDTQDIIKMLRTVFSGEVIRSRELERRRKDGSTVMLAVTAAPVRNADGAITASLGILVDITERRRAQDAVQAERNRLRDILDAMDDAICIVGNAGSIEYANPALDRMFGPAEGKRGETYFDLPGSGLPMGRENPSSNGRTFRHEWYFDKNGRYYDIHIIPIPGFEGTASVLYVFHDITDRKEHERELAGIAKFPLENPHPILRVSADGILMYVNPAGNGLVARWGCHVGGPVPPFLAAAVGDAIDHGTPRDIEFAADREYSAKVVPFPLSGYANIYTRDVTEEKQLQARFLQAQKLETVARLAGGVAHDFNNVISAILGYADLALAVMPPDSPGRGDIGEIIRSSEYAAGLTRQLLTFSRRQTVEPRVLDLNAVISNMNKMLHRLIGEDVQLVTNLAPGLRKVLIDAGQVEQIITNLAVNARDAMPEGGTLTIGTMNVTHGENSGSDSWGPPGDYAMIEVRDTGSGIPEDIREHMFEPFFTTKEKGKGTGLGLATIHGIVAQNRGRIWFESEPGMGTVFRIVFPAAETHPETAQDETAAEIRPEGTETILVVEDEPVIRRLTARILGDAGYHVLVANDGEEGLRTVEQATDTIHMLLTDVIMPHMGGRELVSRVRKLRPDIRVLYVSGYTDGAIENMGFIEPGINFLQKPFSPIALMKIVRRILDGEEDVT